MNWLSLPLDLFKEIATLLDPREVVKLERVCKPWKQLLNSPQIWQAMALATHPALAKCQNISNWREYALRDLRAVQNMKLNRCVMRVIRSSSYRGYDQHMFRCSVVGNEVLIAGINEMAATSYSSTTLMYYKLLNLDTFKETLLDLNATNVLLLKDYFVTSSGCTSASNFEVENKIKIIHRATNKVTSMEKIGNRYKFKDRTVGRPNENHNYNTFVIKHLGTDSFYVVDVEKRTWKEYKMDVLDPSLNLVNRYRLQGKYLAYSQVKGKYKEDRLLYLVVIDTETGQTIFTEKTDQFSEWDITEDNEVILTDHFSDGVKWVLKSFDGKIIHEYNSTKTSEKVFEHSAVRLCGNFIALLKREQFYFFDKITGQLLCCIKTSGTAEHGELYMVGTGKFLYTDRASTRIIDFDSKSLTQPVLVKVLLSNYELEKKNSFNHPPETHKIKFCDLFDLARTIFVGNLKHVASVNITQNNGDKERVSMIYRALGTLEGKSSNSDATKLLADLPYMVPLNMTPYEFVGETLTSVDSVRQYHDRQPLREVHGPALVYREKLVGTEWVPVAE